MLYCIAQFLFCMITFHVISIFPEAFRSYFSASLIKKAQEKKIIKIKFYNPRDFTEDKHKKAAPAFATRKRCGRVDDKPYGGGPGMVIKIEPLIKTLSSIIAKLGKKRKNAETIILSARGKQFNQKMAGGWAKRYKDIILICGRYEGIDERLKKISQDSGSKINEISVGPYILSGGEVAAMTIVDAVSRHIPGVLGKIESLEEKKGSYPVYTRPEIFIFKGKKYPVPKILLSGDHKKILAWRKKYSKII